MLKGHYTTVKETPLHNWNLLKLGDSTALRKRKRGSKKDDAKAYEILMNDYISCYGFSTEMTVLMAKKRELALMINEYFKDVRANRRMLTFIDILESEIKTLEKDKKGSTVMELVAVLRSQGIVVDLKEWTIDDFEHQLRTLKNGN